MDPRMREDNGGEGAYEGRPYGDAKGERVCYGGEIPRLGFGVWHDMWGRSLG